MSQTECKNDAATPWVNCVLAKLAFGTTLNNTVTEAQWITENEAIGAQIPTIHSVLDLWASSIRQEQVEVAAEDVGGARPGVKPQHVGALFPDRGPAWEPEAEGYTQVSPGPARRIARRWVQLSPHPGPSRKGRRSLGAPAVILPLAAVVGLRGTGPGVSCWK